jgi:hypothetical protein
MGATYIDSRMEVESQIGQRISQPARFMVYCFDSKMRVPLRPVNFEFDRLPVFADKAAATSVAVSKRMSIAYNIYRRTRVARTSVRLGGRDLGRGHSALIAYERHLCPDALDYDHDGNPVICDVFHANDAVSEVVERTKIGISVEVGRQFIPDRRSVELHVDTQLNQVIHLTAYLRDFEAPHIVAGDLVTTVVDNPLTAVYSILTILPRGTLLTRRALLTRFPLISWWALFSRFTLRAHLPLFALRPLWTSGTLRAFAGCSQQQGGDQHRR